MLDDRIESQGDWKSIPTKVFCNSFFDIDSTELSFPESHDMIAQTRYIQDFSSTDSKIDVADRVSVLQVKFKVDAVVTQSDRLVTVGTNLEYNQNNPYKRKRILRKLIMSTRRRIDGRLFKSFEESLADVVGDDGAKALVKLGAIPEGDFDPKTINASLSKVFGASKQGLSIVQTTVLRGMSSRLNLGDGVNGNSAPSSFAKSLEAIADTYRLQEKASFGAAGIAAGLISSICCLGPLAFALLGFASLSASLALAMELTTRFKPIELGASVAFLAITIFFQLRRHGQCSLSGVRRNLGYVAIPASALLVTYALVNYWVGVTYLGGARSLLP